MICAVADDEAWATWNALPMAMESARTALDTFIVCHCIL